MNYSNLVVEVLLMDIIRKFRFGSVQYSIFSLIIDAVLIIEGQFIPLAANRWFKLIYKHFSAAPIFLCLYRTICTTLQNTLKCRRSPLHRSHIPGGQIWGILEMQKQFEVEFMQFCHLCDRFVIWSTVLVKWYFLFPYLGPLSRFLPSNAILPPHITRQVTTKMTTECSGGLMFYPLSHTA